MRFSYKKVVSRFLIPRPTLIEWQKKTKDDKTNWRVMHLDYLREQIILEELTREELRSKPIGVSDIFLLSVYLFLTKNRDFIDQDKFKKNLRSFALQGHESVEYRHDFAQKIWAIALDDGSNRKIADYHRVIDLLELLSAAQYALLMRTIIDFTEETREKIKPTMTHMLDGLTWQEIYMYDKAFSDKNILKYFATKGILTKGQSSFDY